MMKKHKQNEAMICLAGNATILHISNIMKRSDLKKFSDYVNRIGLNLTFSDDPGNMYT
jgi:hypothetical protein